MKRRWLVAHYLNRITLATNKQPEKQKPLGVEPNGFLLDRLILASQLRHAPPGCLTFHKCLMLLPSPLRPAERSILFSGKSVRLSDDVRSTASSHAPKKGCAVREVCEADLHVGVAFLCFEPVFIIRAKRFCVIKAWIQGAKRSKVGHLASICNAVAMFLGRKSYRVDDECWFTLWRSKESKCPAGMKRMVKTTPKANHKVQTHFQAVQYSLPKYRKPPFPSFTANTKHTKRQPETHSHTFSGCLSLSFI